MVLRIVFHCRNFFDFRLLQQTTLFGRLCFLVIRLESLKNPVLASRLLAKNQ